ncbi:acyl-CoA thioesterase [Nocardioides caeni]|uniref:Acyl-CoA thioesterase n=1 Tax=Nocardioides caeni TaxID=574700 RepID=A0A4S8NS22_9ACTN|nr:thioesterase family protein [Nocardioides caeni]THV18154.1 acyl-CoA thioesterase [Nocardioides caeni]
MRHRYECPLRWADLDLLGHINNVKYVDYLQEARSALLQACLTAAGVDRPAGDAYVVVRHEVTFVAPLLLRRDTVSVESWVGEIRAASFALEHEIFDEDADGTRTVYLRARTVLAPFQLDVGRPRRMLPVERDALAPFAETSERPRSEPVRVDVPRDRSAHYPVQVRFSDIDVYRHVNNVKYVEYFQESRIALFRALKDAVSQFPRMGVVVAQTDLEYVVPMELHATPFDCWAVVSAFGTKSMTIESEITSGDTVHARSRVVLVFFDTTTQRSVTPPEGYREAVMAAL